MIKTILWAQNESPNIPPSILVNGIPVVDDEAQEAFDKLCEANQKLELSPETREKMYKEGQKNGWFFSRQANYYVLDNKVYIQGCYLEEDNAHRKMPYMYLCEVINVNNLTEAINSLKEESRKLHRTCNEHELRALSLLYESKTKKKIPEITLLILIFVVVICVILSLIN